MSRSSERSIEMQNQENDLQCDEAFITWCNEQSAMDALIHDTALAIDDGRVRLRALEKELGR